MLLLVRYVIVTTFWTDLVTVFTQSFIFCSKKLFLQHFLTVRALEALLVEGSSIGSATTGLDFL
jgi:hypothetical protein